MNTDDMVLELEIVIRVLTEQNAKMQQDINRLQQHIDLLLCEELCCDKRKKVLSERK